MVRGASVLWLHYTSENATGLLLLLLTGTIASTV